MAFLIARRSALETDESMRHVKCLLEKDGVAEIKAGPGNAFSLKNVKDLGDRSGLRA